MAASAAAASTRARGAGRRPRARSGTGRTRRAAGPVVSSWETRCPVSNTWTTPPCTDGRRAGLGGGLDRRARTGRGGRRAAPSRSSKYRSTAVTRAPPLPRHDAPCDPDRRPGSLAVQAGVRIGRAERRSRTARSMTPPAAQSPRDMATAGVSSGRRYLGRGHRERARSAPAHANARRSGRFDPASAAMTRHRSAISTRDASEQKSATRSANALGRRSAR